MNVFAVSMVKDEIDIIESSIRRMAEQVDHLIVADNRSTDGTRELLEQLVTQLPLTLVDDPDPAYYQSAKMSRLAARAADMGASWVIAADADERWYSPFGRVADVLEDMPAHVAVCTAALYDHVPTGLDPVDADPFTRIGWRRRNAAPLSKVAVRPRIAVTIEQGNHGANWPTDRADGQIVVRHFAHRSVEQMIRKTRNGAAAYAATTLREDFGAHWRQWGLLSDEQLGDVFRRYYWSADPHADRSLLYDPAP